MRNPISEIPIRATLTKFDVIPGESRATVFQISLPNKNFLFSASSEAERDEWIAAIKVLHFSLESLSLSLSLSLFSSPFLFFSFSPFLLLFFFSLLFSCSLSLPFCSGLLLCQNTAGSEIRGSHARPTSDRKTCGNGWIFMETRAAEGTPMVSPMVYPHGRNIFLFC
jgi:hypothetical protein